MSTLLTKKQIFEGFRFVIGLDYCRTQHTLEHDYNMIGYTRTAYGWGSNVYQITHDGIAISEGYSPIMDTWATKAEIDRLDEIIKQTRHDKIARYRAIEVWAGSVWKRFIEECNEERRNKAKKAGGIIEIEDRDLYRYDSKQWDQYRSRRGWKR